MGRASSSPSDSSMPSTRTFACCACPTVMVAEGSVIVTVTATETSEIRKSGTRPGSGTNAADQCSGPRSDCQRPAPANEAAPTIAPGVAVRYSGPCWNDILTWSGSSALPSRGRFAPNSSGVHRCQCHALRPANSAAATLTAPQSGRFPASRDRSDLTHAKPQQVAFRLVVESRELRIGDNLLQGPGRLRPHCLKELPVFVWRAHHPLPVAPDTLGPLPRRE